VANPRSSKAAAQSRSSFGTLQQGDLVAGLALSITGVGPAAEGLASTLDVPVVGEGKYWSAALAPPSGWCVILSQDCDLVSDDEAEPTVEISVVEFVDAIQYNVWKAHKYLARYLTLPENSVPGTPQGKQAVIDLAWRTSVLKLSLEDPKVMYLRVFTEPQRRELAAWLGRRSARVPFPDDLIEFVLDPFSAVLDEKARSGSPKPVGSRTAIERLVPSVSEWYVKQTELDILLIGVFSPDSLLRHGWSQEQVDSSVEYDAQDIGRLAGELEKARQQLQTALLTRMKRLAASGYTVNIDLVDLQRVPASAYRQWRRFER
jgi:hypothetical protein